MIEIKKFIKQLFCQHNGIQTTTEVKSEKPCFTVYSRIVCSDCDKCFAQHPNAQCCYVQHLHSEIMREHYIKDLKGYMQGQVKNEK